MPTPSEHPPTAVPGAPPVPRSVLVVEDEAVVARDLRQTLEEIGYVVVGVAATFDEALALANTTVPDVALLDIRIAGARDGVEVATLLRERFDVPVVYLTAHADVATLERAKHTAPYGYLLKPLKYGELRSTLEVALVRHELERHVRRRERWFSTTLRSIADAVVAVDPAGKVTFMNPAAEALTGMKRDDAVGRQGGEVVRLAPVDGGTVAPLDQALASREIVIVRQATLVAQDAREHVIADTAAPVEDNDALLGAVMVFRDITEENAAQLRLQLADRLASLGTLAAGVAHEVNNPLAVIVLNAGYVLDRLERVRPLLEDQEAYPLDVDVLVTAQSDIVTAANRIKHIVRDLTTFGRPTESLDAAASLSRAVEWAVKSTKQTWEDRARVEIDVDPSLPAVAIDDVRLGQLLVNLIVNAAHSIAPADVSAQRIRVRAAAHGDATVQFEVEDTGAGMSPETQARAFDPFFTTKPQALGTGLGLSICRGIVTACGGSLELESRLGHGTTVRVTLPVARRALAGARRPPVGTGSAALRGRVLVVDDEPMVLRAIERDLPNHEVTCVEDGVEALRLIAAGQPFDVLILDVMMPRLGGITLYEQLAASRPELARRVVFATGATTSAAVDTFLGKLQNARIEKPFDARALEQVVQAVLEQHGAS